MKTAIPSWSGVNPVGSIIRDENVGRVFHGRELTMYDTIGENNCSVLVLFEGFCMVIFFLLIIASKSVHLDDHSTTYKCRFML